MSMSLPPSDFMVPGQVYVTKFPGDSKPCFVRKRRERSSFCDALSSAFRFSGRVPRSNKMMSWSLRNWSHPEDDYECYAPARRRRRRFCVDRPGLVPASINNGRLATSISQVCAACGKHRSPAWSSRHPLLPGEMPKPTLCKRCRGKSTSSEDSSCGKRSCQKRKHRCHKHCNHSSEEEQFCSHGGHSHSYSHRHSCGPQRYPRPYSRNASRESVNIFVSNDSCATPMVSEPSSSGTEEEVHVVRKTLPRSRSRGVLVREAVQRPLRHRRSHSSVRIVRSRSPAPQSRSTVHDARPRRRRHRSSSHVSFVDTVDEIPVSRSRRPTFRRVFYDGANSGESEAQRVSSPVMEQEPSHTQIVEPREPAKATLNDRAQKASPRSFRRRISRQRSGLSSVVAEALGSTRDSQVENISPRPPSSESPPQLEKGKGKVAGSSAHRRSSRADGSPSKRQRERTDLPGSGNYSDYYREPPPFAQPKSSSRASGSRATNATIDSPSSTSRSVTTSRSPSIPDLDDLANHVAGMKLGRLTPSFTSSSSIPSVMQGDKDGGGYTFSPDTTPATSFDFSNGRPVSPTPTEETVEYEIPYRIPTPQRQREEDFWELKEYPVAQFDDYVDGSNDFSNLDLRAFGIEPNFPAY